MGFNTYKGRIKNIFNRENFKRFLDKQGFYIILFICICIIGATAFWTSMDKGNKIQMEEGDPEDITQEQEYNNNLNQEAVKQSDKVDIKVKDVVIDPPKGENSDKAEEQPQSLATSNIAKTSTQTVSKPKETSKAVMVKPVEGKILKDFAMDNLLYSRTLKEWTTHPGIDFECELGSEVKAALAGVVEDISEDPLMGIVITIDHGNGLKTRYANLSTKDMVNINQRVEQKQTISGVGRTAAFEILDPPHLHFEVLENGKNVDPKKHFKE